MNSTLISKPGRPIFIEKRDAYQDGVRKKEENILMKWMIVGCGEETMVSG